MECNCMSETRILICDDEEGILKYMKKLLESQGLVVETFTSGKMLLARLQQGANADLLLQDVKMPDMDGLQVLQNAKKVCPGLPVVIMTAFGTIDAAVEAMKLGAYDYVTKPFPKEKILGVLENVLERELLRKENQQLKEELGKVTLTDAIVFASDRFREVYELTLEVAASEANILILGESGTGKELIAGAIHRHSKRRGRRILSINCAALSDTLLESQLFGHVRGAFTGATTNQKGLLEEADSGTLFMDEIGDMSLMLQAKLLRVIQEGDFIPVGATRAKKVDIRFVAATNKNLEKEVAEGRFREDLYYRLNVISIPLPPLRERKEDIEPLARHFLRKYNQRMNKEVDRFTREALDLMLGYSWPGNIRELENVVERAVILARSGVVTTDHLPMWKRTVASTAATGPASAPPPDQLVSLENVEREHIRQTLARTGFHKSRTAEILGISRKTLDRKIAEFGLKPEGE